MAKRPLKSKTVPTSPTAKAVQQLAAKNPQRTLRVIQQWLRQASRLR